MFIKKLLEEPLISFILRLRYYILAVNTFKIKLLRDVIINHANDFGKKKTSSKKHDVGTLVSGICISKLH